MISDLEFYLLVSALGVAIVVLGVAVVLFIQLWWDKRRFRKMSQVALRRARVRELCGGLAHE